MMVFRLILEPRRLTHIDSLGKLTMQKGIVNIHLPQGLTLHDSNNEHRPNGCRFYNGTKSFFIINPRALVIAFGNKLSFEAINCVIWFPFNTKNPLTTDRSATSWGGTKSQVPRLIRAVSSLE